MNPNDHYFKLAFCKNLDFIESGRNQSKEGLFSIKGRVKKLPKKGCCRSKEGLAILAFIQAHDSC